MNYYGTIIIVTTVAASIIWGSVVLFHLLSLLFFTEFAVNGFIFHNIGMQDLNISIPALHFFLRI